MTAYDQKSFRGFFAENRLIDLPITFRKRLHVTVFFHYRDTLDTGCNRPNVTMCHDVILHEEGGNPEKAFSTVQRHDRRI
jgi:hypothetical protein